MKRVAGIGVAVLALVLVSQPAWAARTRFHTAAESQLYGEKAGGMIGRGLLNIVTSFMDVLVTTVNETKAGPAVIGTLKGFAVGTGCGVLRLASGAVDVATFWVPGFNGFPVSDSYDDCLASSGSSAVLTTDEAAIEELAAFDALDINVEDALEPQFEPEIPPIQSVLTIAEPEIVAQNPEPEPIQPEQVWKK